MANFNKVFLMGNLTRDPETRVTPDGLTICKMGLAVNRVFTTKDGERREETTFVDVDAFGRQAEVISKYLSKGRPIFMEGRLRYDQWEDRNTGDKRSKLAVVLESFQFLGGGRGDESSGGNSDGYESQSPPARTTRSASESGAGNATAKSDSGPMDKDIQDDVPF